MLNGGAEAATATEHVLDAMLRETVALMEEASTLGEAPQTTGDAAAALRIAARLARVGGWLLAQAEGATEREEARAGLTGALSSDLDRPEPSRALRDLGNRVERLAARALRLDRLLNASASAGAAAMAAGVAARRDALAHELTEGRVALAPHSDA